jgi:hypothetical protein
MRSIPGLLLVLLLAQLQQLLQLPLLPLPALAALQQLLKALLLPLSPRPQLFSPLSQPQKLDFVVLIVARAVSLMRDQIGARRMEGSALDGIKL